MISYKDMTFCDGNEGKCQAFKGCWRALTPEVQARADKLGLPISQFSDPKGVQCYIAPKEESK